MNGGHGSHSLFCAADLVGSYDRKRGRGEDLMTRKGGIGGL